MRLSIDSDSGTTSTAQSRSRLTTFKFSSICRSRVFTRLTGDIPEISVFMQTNDSNDAPPIVGTY